MGNALSTQSSQVPLEKYSFAALNLAAGWYLYKSMVSPNQIRLETAKDRITAKGGLVYMKAAFAYIALHRLTTLALSGLAASVSIAGAPYNKLFETLGPYVDQINPKFVTWNSTSVPVLSVTAVTAFVRCLAFQQLGVNFTFDLHDPNALITSGIYKYVQHPSYTTAFISFALGNAWFMRVDGPLGAFIPPAIHARLQRYQIFWHTLLTAGLVFGISKRVLDEEHMLKAKFGKEWEEWHHKTPRFVPFLF